MPEKTVPWWRRALNFALDGIRSGFGLLSRLAKSETSESPQPARENERSLESPKEETVLPKQPANPEPLAAIPAAEPEPVSVVEAGKAVEPMTGSGHEATNKRTYPLKTVVEPALEAAKIVEPPVPPPAAPEPAPQPQATPAQSAPEPEELPQQVTEPLAPIEPVEPTPIAAIETPAEPEPELKPELEPKPEPEAEATPPSVTDPEPVAETVEPSSEHALEPVAIPLNQVSNELPAPPEVQPIDAPEQYAKPTAEAELSVSEPDVPAPIDEAAETPETGIAIQPESTHAFEALPGPEIEEAAQPDEPVPTLPPDPTPPSETPVEAEPEPEIAAALEPVPEETPESEAASEPEAPHQAASPDKAALPVPSSVEPAEEPESEPVTDPDPEPVPAAEAISESLPAPPAAPEAALETAPPEEPTRAEDQGATTTAEPVAEPVPTQTEEPGQAPEPDPEPAALSPADEKTAARLAARQKKLDEAGEESPFSVIVAQVYDGPLDLLLDLIRKQDIDIYDIPIAKITAQFLAYVNQLKAGDVDVAGEFIYIASLLIHIKSKMLLPRAPAGPDDTPEDPRRELVERLLEHERFKNAAQMLQQKQLLEAATWTNPGAQEFKDDEGAEPEIAADTVDLVRIFRDILERARKRPVIDVTEDQVTVGQMIQFLARRLTMEDKPVALRRLLSHTRSERALIAMFLALLELVRLQAILLRQDRQFSEIFIKKHTGFDTVMNEGLINAQDDWK